MKAAELTMISGTFIALMALLSSYASDCTPSDDRMKALGWFHGSVSQYRRSPGANADGPLRCFSACLPVPLLVATW